MRVAQVVWLALLAGLLSGCLPGRSQQSTSWLNRFRQLGGPSGPDAVYIDYALVERPAGDYRIGRDVWTHTDEQVLPAETRALIEENGFRVGVVGGLMPADVNALWINPKSQMGRRQRRLYAGNSATLDLTAELPQCRYQYFSPSTTGPTVVSLEQAQCKLSITPTLAEGGKVRLRFAPEIHHRDAKQYSPPGGVGAGWSKSSNPIERFPEMNWEVAVRPTELVVIGAFFERDESLAHQYFVGPAGKNRVQRLLLLRAGQVSGKTPGEASLDEESSSISEKSAKPLTLQANHATVRGVRP